MKKSLEETKKEILEYIQSNGFGVFYGSTRVENGVLWNPSQGDWKNFVNIAKNEDIKTLIYHESMLSEELTELSTTVDEYQIDLDKKEDVQLLKEFRSKLESFEEFSEKMAWVHLSWIKEGVQYVLQLTSPWYDEFLEVQEKVQEFLKGKEEAISLEEKRESLKETKGKLSLLSTQILKWAKSQGLTKVTKGQVQFYLLENEIPLGWTDREMIYTIVNKELVKSYSK